MEIRTYVCEHKDMTIVPSQVRNNCSYVFVVWYITTYVLHEQAQVRMYVHTYVRTYVCTHTVVLP